MHFGERWDQFEVPDDSSRIGISIGLIHPMVGHSGGSDFRFMLVFLGLWRIERGMRRCHTQVQFCRAIVVEPCTEKAFGG